MTSIFHFGLTSADVPTVARAGVATPRIHSSHTSFMPEKSPISVCGRGQCVQTQIILKIKFGCKIHAHQKNLGTKNAILAAVASRKQSVNLLKDTLGLNFDITIHSRTVGDLASQVNNTCNTLNDLRRTDFQVWTELSKTFPPFTYHCEQRLLNTFRKCPIEQYLPFRS